MEALYEDTALVRSRGICLSIEMLLIDGNLIKPLHASVATYSQKEKT